MEHEIQENIEDNDVEETRVMPDEVHYRDFQIESGDKESRTVEMSVSSEAPVTRNWGGVEGIEVLDHSPDSIDLTRFERGAAPLLLDHDPTKQVGVIDSIRLDQSQRKLRATARFGNSSLAKEVYADIVDRIRTNISVGYSVNGYDLEQPENRSETPVFRVNDWTLLEVSSVSIPSDFEVGVGRSINQKPSNYRT
ncbi:MAG: HK97 family phage prohead protease, partial [SAR324 cluster bacterium]|nr:HK97 family phage prohead protease [SAR324 cluster bacterium]